MPQPIGAFISKNVYEGKLLTQHAISSDSCLQFVDVNGQESKLGHSTKVCNCSYGRTLFEWLTTFVSVLYLERAGSSMLRATRETAWNAKLANSDCL